MSGKDPFADFDLPDDMPEADDKPNVKSSQAPGQPLVASAAVSAAQWRTSVFEVQPLKGAKECGTCAYFIPGGTLAIDQIYEVQACDSLIDFSLEARESGWEFERRELEQIIEKARTLDDNYDHQPRVKSYCAAELARGGRTYLIPEIKNRDGQCADHRLGSRPWVKCDDCRHVRPARVTPPSRADYQVSLGDYSSLRDPDFKYDVGILRGAYDRADRQYDARTREYESRLKEDASSVAYGEGDVDNGTIDECSKFYKACAVINRTNRCVHFEDKQAEAASNSLLATAPPTEATRQAHQRAQSEYAEALRRRHETESSAHPRPPCFDCAHKREPVDVEPFADIHHSSKEIMDLRNEYRQARKQQVLEERRISSGPGDGLGDVEAPIQHLWCDKHSRRSAAGQILEYAYCYRVLKAIAPTGKCPSFAPQVSRDATGEGGPAMTPTLYQTTFNAVQYEAVKRAIEASGPRYSRELPTLEPLTEPAAPETQEERRRRLFLEKHEAKRQRKLHRGRLGWPWPG